VSIDEQDLLKLQNALDILTKCSILPNHRTDQKIISVVLKKNCQKLFPAHVANKENIHIVMAQVNQKTS
jgi:hypothetical protein